MENITRLAKALSDPSRVRILLALQEHEVPISTLAALVELDASTMTKHLSVLERAGLIRVRKDGRWRYCSANAKNLSLEANLALHWVKTVLAEDDLIKSDACKLNRSFSYRPRSSDQRDS